MLRNLLSSGFSWLFSKGFSMPLLLIVSIGLGLLWRNAVALSEAQTDVLEERLKNEQTIALSWRAEALRLQGVVMGSADTLAACLEREVEASQTQMTTQRLLKNLRQKTEQVKQSSMRSSIHLATHSATEHKEILEYLERPLQGFSPSKALLSPVVSKSLPNNVSTKVAP